MAIDDATRLVYAELLPDERRYTTAHFAVRAVRWFAAQGIAVERVLTDNGSPYRSRPFARVERWIRTVLSECLYLEVFASSEQRRRGLERFVAFYNDRRPHLAFKGDPPAARAVIRRFRRMVAINSAIELDLSGQVVADSIARIAVLRRGRQMDFIRGAALAEEGRAIIGLPSTAASGSASRIVPSLREGAGVVTTRAHVRTVVTEWGVAELFGCSLAERAMRLIAIAHPNFRDELRLAARRLHLEQQRRLGGGQWPSSRSCSAGAGWPFGRGRSALGSTGVVTHDQHMVRDDIRVRRVAPGDAPELERFYAELSADSRVSRFHSASRGISHAQAEVFAAADHWRRDGFVAVAGGRIVGHLALEPMADGIEELAVAVDDRIQHHGVGTLLLAAAVASARLRGIRCIVGWVRAENGAMGHLLAASHHRLRLGWEGPVARYELEVPPPCRVASA